MPLLPTLLNLSVWEIPLIWLLDEVPLLPLHLHVVDFIRYPGSSPSVASDELCTLKQIAKSLDLARLSHLNSFIGPNSFAHSTNSTHIY